MVLEWSEVTEDELQQWLDTHSPDYRLRHVWANNWIECVDKNTGDVFAYQRRDKRCFVHPRYHIKESK